MKPKVFVQPPWEGPTIELFQRYGYEIVNTPEECDIIAFNGGEDISPAIYKQEPLEGAHVYWSDARDKQELEGYERAKDKFKFGICRGGQLLNCLNGGVLWQDVTGHQGGHQSLILETGETVWTSSVHHQMMIPAKGAVMLAVAAESGTKFGILPRRKGPSIWHRGNVSGVDQFADDPEVLFYPKDRALCIQGHPEYAGYTKFTNYCMELIEKYYG